MGQPKYPNIEVDLSDSHSAFSVMTVTGKMMFDSGVDEKSCKEFVNEALAAGPKRIIETVEKWVKIE